MESSRCHAGSSCCRVPGVSTLQLSGAPSSQRLSSVNDENLFKMFRKSRWQSHGPCVNPEPMAPDNPNQTFFYNTFKIFPQKMPEIRDCLCVSGWFSQRIFHLSGRLFTDSMRFFNLFSFEKSFSSDFGKALFPVAVHRLTPSPSLQDKKRVWPLLLILT